MASGHPKYSTSGPPQRSTHSNIVLPHCPYSSMVHSLQHPYKMQPSPCPAVSCVPDISSDTSQSLSHGRAETSPSFRVVVICFMSICFTRCELEEQGLPVHLLAASRWEELHMAHSEWNNFIQHRLLGAGGAVQGTWLSLNAPRSPLHKQGISNRSVSAQSAEHRGCPRAGLSWALNPPPEHPAQPGSAEWCQPIHPSLSAPEHLAGKPPCSGLTSPTPALAASCSSPESSLPFFVPLSPLQCLPCHSPGELEMQQCIFPLQPCRNCS